MKLIMFITIITLTTSCSADKPKLCDCQNLFLKDVEDAMNIGKSDPSREMKNCEEFYSTDEIINASCGINKYDPNFKAK